MDVDYADDQGLLVNTPPRAEYLLHDLEGTYMNPNNTEFFLKKRSWQINIKRRASKIIYILHIRVG